MHLFIPSHHHFVILCSCAIAIVNSTKTIHKWLVIFIALCIARYPQQPQTFSKRIYFIAFTYYSRVFECGILQSDSP